MSFLSPLFLAGALAIALPLVFHLMRRTAKEKLTFSSLMFLKPIPPRLTRRSRLEDVGLLILRCLALLLLALAFSRPFIKRPLAMPLSKNDPKAVLMLIDVSASMQTPAVWNAAREAALKRAASLRDADRFAILAFDQSIRTLVAFSQWEKTPTPDRASLAGRTINDLKPGWGGTDLGIALTSALQSFEEIENPSPNLKKEMVLISDLQEGARIDAIKGFEWPKNFHLSVEAVGRAKISNAGVHLLAERQPVVLSNSVHHLRLRVINASNSVASRFKLQLVEQGKTAGGNLVDVQVAPGQQRVVSFPVPAGVRGEIRLQGDDLPFDNRCFVAPLSLKPAKVIYYGKSDESDTSELFFFLKRAFSSQTNRVEIVANPGASTGAGDEVALRIVGGELPATFARSIHSAVTNGATLLWVLKDASSARNLGAFLGRSLDSREQFEPGSYQMLGEMEMNHPLFAPFADPRFSDFSKIHFWKHRRLDAEIPDARVLARFDDRDPALLELSLGRGVLYVLTSGWQPADSQLALSSKFVPLLYSLIEMGGGLNSTPAHFLVGDPLPLLDSRTNQAVQGSMTLRKPDGKEETLTAGQKYFAESDQPGLYQLLPENRWLAVNLTPEESRTAPMSIDFLDALGVPLKAGENSPQSIAPRLLLKQNALELEGQQKWWRWLVALVLVILMIETWLAGQITRKTQLAPST